MDFFARQEAARRATRWLLVAFLVSVVAVGLAAAHRAALAAWGEVWRSLGAVLAMTKVAALEHARDGIRVNAICPGYIDTPMMGNAMSPAARERFSAAASLGRTGRPEEIGRVARFLLSDDASFPASRRG